MKIELKQQFQIDSARQLRGLPSGHPCARMHGHTFKIVLTLEGTLDPKIGWVRDYHEISKTMEPLIKMLDHQVLNEVPGLGNPTSEHLAIWLFERAKPLIPELTRVTIAETPTTECSYPASSSTNVL